MVGCAKTPQGVKAEFYLPVGSPIAGQKAFGDLKCFVCHDVAGGGFPAPHAQPPVSVRLDSHLAGKSPHLITLGYDNLLHSPRSLVESIVSPSHRTTNVSNPAEKGLSRMGDYSEVMTVRQLIDLVAYLCSVVPATPTRK